MNYALITGAAKGIGKSLAFELAHRGYHLLLVDVDEISLLKTAQLVKQQTEVEVHLLVKDLSDPQAAQDILHWYQSNFKDLQILVNNAGFGLNGEFRSIPLEEQLDIVRVNICTQVALTYLFIPVLEMKSPGYILNVGSTTAYQTVPYMTMYSASKHFVVTFNRGMRHELRHNSRISLTCLSPGATNTDFVNRARMGESIKKTAERFNMTSEEVAKIGIDALFKGKAEVVAGWFNKFGAFIPRFFPEKFICWVVGNIYEPKIASYFKSDQSELKNEKV